MEKHEPADAIQTLKKALDAIAAYKIEGDSMFKQLHSQEKEVRKIHSECSQKIKEIKKKEKQRAKAMFGGRDDEKKDTEQGTPEKSAAPRASTPDNMSSSVDPESRASPRSVTDMDTEEAASPPADDSQHAVAQPPKKRVSFADGTSPGDDFDNAAPSFFEEHMEALLLVAGCGLGCWLMSMAWKKR
jgi:hypothetical protein